MNEKAKCEQAHKIATKGNETKGMEEDKKRIKKKNRERDQNEIDNLEKFLLLSLRIKKTQKRDGWRR